MQQDETKQLRRQLNALSKAATLGGSDEFTSLYKQLEEAGLLPIDWWDQIDTHRVASGGYVEIMRFVLSAAGAEATQMADSCLTNTLYAGHADMFRLLLQYAPPLTPFVAAACMADAINRGHTALVRFFLDEYGLDIHTRGIPASFEAACFYNTHPNTVALLLERADTECLVKWKLWRALVGAAECGKVEVVKLLLAYGAEVNRFSEGHTPLMRAAKSGHVEIVHLLLEAGADREAKWNRKGEAWTVLECAQAGGNAEIIRMLL